MAQQDTPMPDFDIIKTISTFLPFAILWGWGKLGLDTNDPVVLWGIRGLFAFSQLLNFGIIFALEQKIKANSGQKENSKMMKYVVKRAQNEITEESPDQFEYKEQQVYEYDLEQLTQLKAFLPLAITIGIHLYFGAIQPLIIQAFSGPLRLLENNVLKIHYLGKEIERPFVPAPSPFASLLGQKSEKEQMDEWDAQQQSKKKPNNQVTNKKHD